MVLWSYRNLDPNRGHFFAGLVAASLRTVFTVELDMFCGEEGSSRGRFRGSGVPKQINRVVEPDGANEAGTASCGGRALAPPRRNAPKAARTKPFCDIWSNTRPVHPSI